MGSMLISFTGTALQKSAFPAITMARFYERNQVADNIIADYMADYMHMSSGALSGMKADIDGNKYDNSRATVSTQYIAYDSGFNEIADGGSEGILKVTVTPTSGEDGLTTSFLLIE